MIVTENLKETLLEHWQRKASIADAFTWHVACSDRADNIGS
jgi:hypothetical protein